MTPLLLLLVFAVVPSRLVVATPYTENFTLYIHFGETPVGTVEFQFEQQAGQLTVHSKLSILESKGDEVVYERTERRREIWQDGKVLAFTNDIVENGTASQVTAIRIGSRVAITGPNGTAFAPANSVPATFWSIDTVNRFSVYDVQTGDVLLAETIRMPAASQRIRGQNVKMQQFLVTGDLTRNLFYTPDNQWAGMRYLGRDARLVNYLLQ
ncbi:MAG: hypothetical protein GY791_08845 [Alphaproteobacteria bacterium]|nr:hypothetical protein [Alphaproteobacteria bacterium]